MFKYHITGFTGFSPNDTQRTNIPVDITVYADVFPTAITKAELALCEYISLTNRNVVVEEVLDESWANNSL